MRPLLNINGRHQIPCQRRFLRGETIRNLIFALITMLCSSCALLPVDIPYAPQKQAPAVVFDIDGTLTPRPIEVCVGSARQCNGGCSIVRRQGLQDYLPECSYQTPSSKHI